MKTTHLLFLIASALLSTAGFITTSFARAPLPERTCHPQNTARVSYELPIVGVSDGDTLKAVFPAGSPTPGQQRIRLVEIDAPESSQAFGQASKKALSALVFGRKATVVVRGNDRYCRPLAEIYVGARYVNLDMVRQGYAWANREFGRDPRFRDAEQLARRERAGLWADRDPAYPGDYRRKGGDHVRG